MKPRYDDTTDALLAHHGSELAACIGQVLHGAWVAWDRRDDAWLEDEAVVLCVGENLLGVNCWKLNEIALGWNCVDLDSAPKWVAEWGPDFDLEWRKNSLPALQSAAGQRVRAVNVLEYLYRTTVVRAPRNPALEGTVSEAWLLHGIELVLESVTLTLFNALDKNGLTLDVSAGPEFRRTSVPRPTLGPRI